jgi:hydrogenase nickel incorporation protein HypB
MCNTCGCNLTPGNQHLLHEEGPLTKITNGKTAIQVLSHLLSENDHQAVQNREHFDQHGVLAFNLMSSPGSGKTTLLEATLEALKGEFAMAVIEGDLETENDAQRIRRKGVPALQIVTGTACHLDAHLVHNALHHFDLTALDIVFIENVGNLVCPASFDLGQHRNVTLLSTTEGDDKPAKYPVMFRATDVLLITKMDLLPMLDDFEVQRAEQYLRQLANPAPVIQLSAKKVTGMTAWLDWLRNEVATQRSRLPQGQTARPGQQQEGMRLQNLSLHHTHDDDHHHHHHHHHHGRHHHSHQ